jgi:hypothetical protein
MPVEPGSRRSGSALSAALKICQGCCTHTGQSEFRTAHLAVPHAPSSVGWHDYAKRRRPPCGKRHFREGRRNLRREVRAMSRRRRQGRGVSCQKCSRCPDGGRRQEDQRDRQNDNNDRQLLARATTLFDYIRRAMPWTEPRLLSDNELYALTVCILAQNKLIVAKLIIDAQSLPGVQMPNRDDFLPRFPERTPSK